MSREDARQWPERYRLRALLPWCAVAVVVAGVIVRLSVRDSLPIVSVAHYSLPYPVLAAIALVGGVLWWTGSRRSFAVACAAAAVALLSVWLFNDYHRHSCDGREEDVRILFWNTANGFGGWDDIVESIRSVDADGIVLAEVGGTDAEFWQRRFPDMEVLAAGRRIMVLSDGAVELESVERIGRGSRCAALGVEVGDRPFRFVVVDFESNPLADRRPLMDEVLAVAGARRDVPTLLMGDFNTPPDSVAFEPLRLSFDHAFERAGRGLLVTWPMPFPVIAIDHVWVPRNLALSCARLRWTAQSDHAQVIVSIAGNGS